MVLKHADWIQHIATERCRTCKHLCPLEKFSFEEVRRCCNIFLARTPCCSSTVWVDFWDIIIFFVLAACIRWDIVLVVGRIFTMWDIEHSPCDSDLPCVELPSHSSSTSPGNASPLLSPSMNCLTFFKSARVPSAATNICPTSDEGISLSVHAFFPGCDVHSSIFPKPAVNLFHHVHDWCHFVRSAEDHDAHSQDDCSERYRKQRTGLTLTFTTLQHDMLTGLFGFLEIK